MKFEDIIEGLNSGKKQYARAGWEDKNIVLGTMPNPVRPTFPIFVIIQNAGGIPITQNWLTHVEDREAIDWFEFEPAPAPNPSK